MRTRRVAAAAIFLVMFLTLGAARGGDRGVVNTASSPHVRLRSIDLDAARWTDGFWADRWDLCRRVIVPNMREVMLNPGNSANFVNLQIAAGVREGQFFGNNWSDGDCYKLVEAMAALYMLNHDPQLDRWMDEWIDVIAKAQAPDGYISTQIQLTGKKRWQNLSDHELYNMGHLLTAACIHYRATGKDNFLNVARKLGDYLYTVFDPRPKELAHFCFNPSNVMGAAELYRTTGDAKYLKLAKTFVDMRGSQPGGSDQNQSAVPLRREQEAVGHCVTAPYLWCGAADVYAETGEKALFDALERLWQDVNLHKQYVTGAIGALHFGESQRQLIKRRMRDPVHEAFGAAYQLPNRTAYSETCANIANAMWNWRMLQLTGEARYADVMERVLYNSMLSAMGLEGKSFFYTNVLRRSGKDVPLLNNDSAARWPNTTRQSPVFCFCCPPSVARTIAELGGWAYGLSDDAVWVHLYGSGVLETKLAGGSAVRLVEKTQYPWDGHITFSMEKAPEQEMALMLRIPGWSDRAAIQINGQPWTGQAQAGSYAEVRRRWTAGDRVELDLPMDVILLEANPLVEEARNHAAVMRGPVVYCLESVDVPKDVKIEDVRLPRKPTWNVHYEPQALGGVALLETEGGAMPNPGPWTGLYRKMSTGQPTKVPLRLIPYYAWSNRGESEMTVWIPLE